MAMTKKEIISLIKESLTDANVTIDDLKGDGNHYSATIVSESFHGKSKIEQHKMVYNALSEELKEELHALSIKTMEKK